MKNIIHIFLKDLRGLSRNFFALIIAIGLCFIPSFYAWFNIYSNQDPYANTGNIAIAVASEDRGFQTEDGTTVNMGNAVIEQLKENDSIGWKFLDSSEEAVAGVESGDYYAAVIINERFSESMFSIFTEGLENPTITYYENEKKNAIATKITDTAVDTLKASINETFLETAASTMFAQMGELSGKIEQEGGVDGFREKLVEINGSLENYNMMIDQFLEGNRTLAGGIEKANAQIPGVENRIQTAEDAMKNSQTQLDTTDATLATFSQNVEKTLSDIEASLNRIAKDIDEADLSNSAKKTVESIEQTGKDVRALIEQLTLLHSTISELEQKKELAEAQQMDVSDILAQIEKLKEAAAQIEDILKKIELEQGAEAIGDATKTVEEHVKQSLATCRQTVESMRNIYTNQLVPGVSGILDTASQVLVNVTNLLNNLNHTLGDMETIFNGTQDMVDSTDESFRQIQSLLKSSQAKIQDAIDRLDAAEEDEKMGIIVNLLGGNAESYGKFFAQPVQVETQEVYPIRNYGSAVAPFYTTLAIWVGALVLVALIKVRATGENLEKPKRHELFMGRYLIFFLLGQVQTLIIVLGNIFWLHCQVENPFLFWFASAITSFTFTLLIYALTLSFGDIGKAIAVVLVVIQIAGSGGTYPIEILPEFFRKVYIFFPFPYAINAMRETVGGMYGGAYEKYLAELLIFAAVALLVGLLIRIPFMGVIHFVEKRMEDTKMM